MVGMGGAVHLAEPWVEHVERKKIDTEEHGRKGKRMNKVRGREQE